jgi:hypothetical protein
VAGPPSPPTYRCPFCPTVRSSVRDLDSHVITEHTVLRPYMMIDGREPAKHQVIRRSFPAANLHVNAAEVSLSTNGKTTRLSPTKLASTLAKLTYNDVVVTLTNSSRGSVAPVSQSYSLSFRVAEAGALEDVEKAFADTIDPLVLKMTTIRSFVDDTRCQGDGADYAAALAAFLLGIKRKEDPDSLEMTTPSAMYRESYVLAEEGLRDFERPLARVITQLTRFALNDFSAEPIVTGFSELDLAYRLLRDPQGDARPVKTDDALKKRKICPVDHGTGRILDLFARMYQRGRWSRLLDTECRDAAQSKNLDAMDQQKAAAIWAISAKYRGATKDAIEPLSIIATTYPFSIWAGRYLEDLTR